MTTFQYQTFILIRLYYSSMVTCDKSINHSQLIDLQIGLSLVD